MLFGSCPIPLADDIQQHHIARKYLHFLAVGVLECTESAHDVRRLPYDEPEIRQFDRDVLEAKQWARFSLVEDENVGVQLERRQ